MWYLVDLVIGDLEPTTISRGSEFGTVVLPRWAGSHRIEGDPCKQIIKADVEGEPSLLSVNSVDPISAISACVISSFLSKFFSKSRIPRVSIIVTECQLRIGPRPPPIPIEASPSQFFRRSHTHPNLFLRFSLEPCAPSIQQFLVSFPLLPRRLSSVQLSYPSAG